MTTSRETPLVTEERQNEASCIEHVTLFTVWTPKEMLYHYLCRFFSFFRPRSLWSRRGNGLRTTEDVGVHNVQYEALKDADAHPDNIRSHAQSGVLEHLTEEGGERIAALRATEENGFCPINAEEGQSDVWNPEGAKHRRRWPLCSPQSPLFPDDGGLELVMMHPA